MHAAALLHYRQCTDEINKMIADMLASSITPSKILISLLKKDVMISLQDIYNKRQVNKRKLLDRLSPIGIA
jgi:hypothetical protein